MMLIYAGVYVKILTVLRAKVPVFSTRAFMSARLPRAKGTRCLYGDVAVGYYRRLCCRHEYMIRHVTSASEGALRKSVIMLRYY